MALTKVPSNLDAAISVTQSSGDNSTKVATTSYVDTAISALSDSAPAALNTLNEIAAALGDDANYASTTTTAIAEKLPLAGGTMTGALIVDAGNSGLDIRLGTDKRVTWSGGIGEIGSVAGFQAINTAGSALASFGIRGTDLRFATGSAERMRITDAGINVTGTVQADNLTMLDSEYIRLGASNDLQIFHDGNHSMIQDLVGTGALKIKSNDTRFEDADGNNIIKATSTAAELYFSGGKKLFTTAAGVEATAITTTGVVNEFTTSSSWGRNLLLTNTNNDVSPPIMTFLKSPAGGHTQMADNDYVGFINFRGDNTANQEHSYVEISVRATDVSDGSEDSKLTIGTWGDGTEYGNTLVASSGKVGIGTASFAADGSSLLQVAGRLGIMENTGTQLQISTGSTYAWMEAWDNTADRAPKRPICFNPWGGNVGIGNTNPGSKLHVNAGYIKAENTGTDAYFFEGIRTGAQTTLRIYDNANNLYIDSHTNMNFRVNQTGSGSGGNFAFGGGNVAITNLLAVNKAVNGSVGLSVGSDAASATSYGLEVCNNASNTRFLVDGLGSQRFYGSDSSETARFTDGNLRIKVLAPLAPLHVNVPGNPDGYAVGGKNLSMTTAFQTGAQLEITLGDHQGCYVKVFVTGDWGSHSAMAFMGEYFIQNGANGYSEPGMIIREVDNTSSVDSLSSQIYDGGNVDSFQIQFKLNRTMGPNTTSANLTYQVMGQFDSIT